MAQKITRNVKVTAVHGFVLDASGNPEPRVEFLPGTFTKEKAEKLVRKTNSAFMASHVDVETHRYSLSLTTFIYYAGLEDVAETAAIAAE